MYILLYGYLCQIQFSMCSSIDYKSLTDFAGLHIFYKKRNSQVSYFFNFNVHVCLTIFVYFLELIKLHFEEELI